MKNKIKVNLTQSLQKISCTRQFESKLSLRSFALSLKMTVAGMSALALTACNGIFDDIYDQPEDAVVVSAKGQLLMDATSWTDWYYVDLPQLQKLTEAEDEEGLQKAQTEFVAYPIPMEAVGEASLQVANGEKTGSQPTNGEKAGQYMYWFDVFGEGITKSEFREFTPTAAQAEPDSWSFAIHRNNVRTNGGAVLETTFTSMSDLPESSDAFKTMNFTEDEWSENEVWDSQDQMLLGLVPSQGIRVNKVLSSWLTMEIPPMPPRFTLNNHVFILRLKDGTYAALQLENYLSPTGTKCWMTINYKYPY